MTSDPHAYRKNVAAVIMDVEGRVLLGRKKEDSKYYHFPQGGVGRRESFEDALWREIVEETGLHRTQMRILARLAGLSYKYRRKNKKSSKWEGQEQTYYLIEYTGDSDILFSPSSEEFTVFEWVHYSQLSPELFVSFKREVIEEVLEAFFPRGIKDLQSHIASLDTEMRYRFLPDSSLSHFSPTDRALFLGDKVEAKNQMLDLQKRITNAQLRLAEIAPHLRILVLLHALPCENSKRRVNALRRLASLFDPLLTRVPLFVPGCDTDDGTVLPQLVRTLPSGGETLILADTPYSLIKAENAAESICLFEKLMLHDGVCMFKFFLNITPDQWDKSGAGSLYSDYLAVADAQLTSTSGEVPWYVVPSDKKWYRDYVIASIMAQSLENLVDEYENPDSTGISA